MPALTRPAPRLQKTPTKKTQRDPRVSEGAKADAACLPACPLRSCGAAPKACVHHEGPPWCRQLPALLQDSQGAAAGQGGRGNGGHSGHPQSTDSYFTDPNLLNTGIYRFDVGRMQANHGRDFEAFCDSLASGIHTVIVDNTNTQACHYQCYEEEAEQQGYEVQEVVVGMFTRRAAEQCAARSVHDVPLDKVMRMLEQWWEENGGETEDEEA